MEKEEFKKIFPEQSEPLKGAVLGDGKDSGDDAAGILANRKTDDIGEFISSPPGSSSEQDIGKEKYLREIARIEDLPEDEDSVTSRQDQSHNINTGQSSEREIDNEIPGNEEGRTNEWQDRARVSNEQENIDHKTSPRQSNVPREDTEDVEEKSPNVRDTFY